MQLELADFLSQILDRRSSEGPPATVPLLLIDECANQPAVSKVISSAVQMHIARGSSELWSQLRLRADGSHSQLTGRPDHFARLAPGHDIGKPVPGFSWPDIRVAEAVVGSFSVADRLVVLTANSRNDPDGLRNLLTKRVAPVLESSHRGRFGLLVLMKSGKTPWDMYGARLLERLLSKAVLPGFEYRRVSSQGAV